MCRRDSCKKVFDDGRVLSTAYKRPQTMKGGHEWWKYVYDEYYDLSLIHIFTTSATMSCPMRSAAG